MKTEEKMVSNYERITPEQVATAYDSTGLKPINNDWGFVDSEKNNCGCALTAITLSRMSPDENFDFHELLLNMESSAGMIAGNYPEQYLQGFMNAYDGDAFESSDANYRMGAEDGEAAFKHMILHNGPTWHEVIKADYYIPVGQTNKISEFFLEEAHANDFAQKHNLKLVRIGKAKLTTEDYNLIFPQYSK